MSSVFPTPRSPHAPSGHNQPDVVAARGRAYSVTRLLGHAPARSRACSVTRLLGEAVRTRAAATELASVADANLYLPQLAVRGQTLPTSAQAGVNQFYIVESRYRETRAGGAPRLRLALDNYADLAGGLIAQLKLAYDASLRARGTARQVVSPGVPLSGPGGAVLSNQTAGTVVQIAVPYGVTLAKSPTSITLTAVNVSNATAVTAINISQTGFTLQWTVTAAGTSAAIVKWTTVGN